MSSPPSRHSLAAQLLITTPIRVLLNTAYRMVYPFSTVFSRGLGVPPEALAQLLALRNAVGLVGPLLGLVPDRYGRRFAVLAGLGVFTAGFAAAALWPSWPTFALAVFGALFAKALHDPALLAHLGDQTPPERRGLVVGVSEFGWAGATFVGMPVLGWLIGRFGWSAPFAPLAVLGLLALAGLSWVVTPRLRARGSARTPFAWRSLLQPQTLVVLSYGGVTSFANEMLNVVYGGWLEQTFGLGAAALGVSVAVIGVAELAGEGLVALFSDRFGKRRMILAATVLAAGAFAVLPLLGGQLWLALSGLFLVFLGFETGIVANIPLVIDLRPESRSTMISASGALHSVGRTAGALLGAWLMRMGFGWVGAAAALVNVGMAVWVWAAVREGRPPASN